MPDTIREFVVALGWQLDEAGERRFISAIEGAALRANLLAAALEDMARIAVAKVGQVAETFEQRYYQSQRVGASTQSIRAFEFTIKQLGGSVEGANAALESFGEWVRTVPHGAEALARNLGIPLKDTADKGKFLLEVYEKLSHMSPQLATVYRNAYPIGDFRTATAGGRPGAPGYYEEELKRQQEAGIGAGTTDKAAKLEREMRDFSKRMDDLYIQLQQHFFDFETSTLELLNKYLEDHKKKISEFVDWLGTLGFISDIGKSSVHFDETKFAEHFEKALSAAETATVLELKKLETALHPVVDWFERFGRVLSNFFMQPYMSSQGQQDVLPDAGGAGGDSFLGRMWGGVKHALGIGDGAPAGIRARGAGGAPVGKEADLAKQAYTYWRGQGLSHDQALSVLGNQRGENALGALNDAGGSGQFQWDNERRMQIFAGTGIDVHDAGFMDQQKAARWEMEHSPDSINRVWDQLKAAKSRDEAMGTLVHNYERSLNQGSDIAIRLGYADRYGKIIPDGNAAAPTPAAPGLWHKGGTPSGPIDPAHGTAPLTWDQGQIWNGLNAQLPVGPSTTDNSSKNVSSSVTNNITVNGPDPQSAAAMVGVHLDRSANDISRNLQGAFQ